MFRKAILGLGVCVLTLGTVSTADAQFPQPQPQPLPAPGPGPQPLPPPLPPPVPQEHYHVMYRACPSTPWTCYHIFNCPIEARRYSCLLEQRGYYSKVVCH